MNINLAVYAVRSEDGSVNVEETKAKFLLDLSTYVTSQTADQETVLGHINQFYTDVMPGAAVPMTVLYSYVAGKMKAFTGEAHKTVKERCDAVIKSNPNTFTQERRTGTYRTADRKPKSENKAA